MGVLDKVIAAVTPPESDEARVEARMKARSMAPSGGWFAMVLDHHEEIEAAFTAVDAAPSAEDKRMALKRLAALLTGHSMAEEAVIYPAMAVTDQKAHSGEAYVEQSAAKVQVAALEYLDPMSQDFRDKLGHLRGAVQHHVYREEGTWFPKLLEDDEANQAKLASRYSEEYRRYMGNEAIAIPQTATM
jgi:hemerythrin superfamily protein